MTRLVSNNLGTPGRTYAVLKGDVMIVVRCQEDGRAVLRVNGEDIDFDDGTELRWGGAK